MREAGGVKTTKSSESFLQSLAYENAWMDGKFTVHHDIFHLDV